MSILAGLQGALAGRGSGRVTFPEGTHLVRLAEVEVLTNWTEDKPVTFKWDETTVTGAYAIIPKYVILGDGTTEDSAPMSIQPIVLPTEIPADFAGDIKAVETYQKGDPKLPGAAWRFHFSRQDLLSLLNVAMGQPSAAFVEDPDAMFEAVREAASPTDGPVFQVTVSRKPRANDPSKFNTEVEFALPAA